ncbi:MAG: outer membrane beta-barrel protein [Candidatus Adiutrix sp.]|jgi:opacity protein-like surface antigen|nr:outer membrane beta-barrel protein [Candidatus Adiutrix sp.]
MEKKFLSRNYWMLSLGLTLALGLAAPAAAQDMSSFYVTPKIMASYQTVDMHTGDERSSVLGFGGSVGSDLSYSTSWPLRLEAEYLYHGNETFSRPTDCTIDLSAHSFLANAFLDLNTDTALTPYLGGGLGLAYLTDRASYGNATSKGSRWNFAWDVGGGVAWGLNENLALDLGYRYMDLGKSHDNDIGGVGYNVSLTAHEFSLGLRVMGF